MKNVMKNKKVLAIASAVVLVAVLLISGVIADPLVRAYSPPLYVESKINYQGQLTDNAGNPLDGAYDMEFLFYDAASGGIQVGSTITKNNVQVSDGLFSIKLDVDQTDFDGRGLWMEVRVGGETLSPRQEILPVPYALSLKPGAEINGASTGAHILYIYDSDTQTTYDALMVHGETSLVAGSASQVPLIVANAAGEALRTLGDINVHDGELCVDSTSDIAVYGTTGSNDADTPAIKGENNGDGHGVLGTATGYDAYGVYGKSGFGTGVRGEGETGVWGESTLGPGVVGKGVAGVQGMSEIGHGVYARSEGGAATGSALLADNTNPTNGIAIWGRNNSSDTTLVVDNDGSGPLIKGFGGDGGEDEFRVSNNGKIETKADSYIFISGNQFIKNVNTDSTRWDCQGNGAVKIWRGGTPGNKAIYVPVTLPGVLYGQDVTVEELTVNYKCQDGTENYITGTRLWKQTDTDSGVVIVTDYTHLTSNTADSYTLTLTANNTLSSDQGILGLYMELHFNDDSNYIQIGGVKIKLGHHSLY